MSSDKLNLEFKRSQPVRSGFKLVENDPSLYVPLALKLLIERGDRYTCGNEPTVLLVSDNRYIITIPQVYYNDDAYCNQYSINILDNFLLKLWYNACGIDIFDYAQLPKINHTKTIIFREKNIDQMLEYLSSIFSK